MMNQLNLASLNGQLLVFVMNVVMQVTVLSIVSLSILFLVRKRPVIRYWISLFSMLLILLCPVVIASLQLSGEGLITVWLNSSKATASVTSLNHRESNAVNSSHENGTGVASYERSGEFNTHKRKPNSTGENPAHAFRNSQSRVENQLEETQGAVASGPRVSSSGLSFVRILYFAVLPLTAIWLTIAMLFLLRLVFGWSRLARVLKEADSVTNRAVILSFEQACAQVGFGKNGKLASRRCPELVMSDRISSPLAAGVFRAYVVLPTQFVDQLDSRQLRHVLIHEAAHVARRDQVVVLAQNLMAAVFWFHPLVRILNRQLARASEEICDNYVLKVTEASAYCRTVLSMAETMCDQPIPGAVGLLLSRWKLEHRVSGLLDEQRQRSTQMTLKGLLLLTALTLFLATSISLGTMTLAADDSVSSDAAIFEDVPTDEGSERSFDQEKKKPASDRSEVTEKYKFDFQIYNNNPEKGFSLVMKLIARAKRDKAPPEVLAKLYYSAARLQRSIAFRSTGEKDFEPALAILNSVVKNPKRYLANFESACWYSNCISLLVAIHGKGGTSDDEIAGILKKAVGTVESEMRLSQREKLFVLTGIRMTGSDASLRAKDWKRAIEWVSPVLKQADVFLQDEEGAARIAMSTRQQSMFLAYNGDYKKSSELIDSMCERLKTAKQLSAETKLSLQCMLRGKHLINFEKNRSHPLADEGWKKYESLRKQIRARAGKLKPEVLRSLANMDRLAVACMKPEKIDRAIKILDDTIEMYRNQSKLRDPSFRALWFLQDMSRMLSDLLRIKGDGRAARIKATVDEFVTKCKKEAKRKK